MPAPTRLVEAEKGGPAARKAGEGDGQYDERRHSFSYAYAIIFPATRDVLSASFNDAGVILESASPRKPGDREQRNRRDDLARVFGGVTNGSRILSAVSAGKIAAPIRHHTEMLRHSVNQLSTGVWRCFRRNAL